MSEMQKNAKRTKDGRKLMAGDAGRKEALLCLRNLLRGEEGANLVESAISLLLFLALLFGIIEFGWMFLAYQNVADAARQAARWASVRGEDSCSNVSGLPGCDASGDDVTNYIVHSLYVPAIDTSKLTVDTSWCAASWNLTTNTMSWPTCSTTGRNVAGNQVQVKVTYTFPINLPYLSKSFTLSSTGAMIIAQ